MTGCRARSASLLIHRNLFLLLSRDRNLHGSGMSHATSLSKTIHQGILEGGWHCGQQRKCWMDNIKEWTFLPCQNCSQGPPAGKTGRGSLLNRRSCPPNDPISQGTELNCVWPPWVLMCSWYLTVTHVHTLTHKGESVAHSGSTHSWKPGLCIIKHGPHMDGWPFCARFCTLTVGGFPWSQNSVQTVCPAKVLLMRL